MSYHVFSVIVIKRTEKKKKEEEETEEDEELANTHIQKKRNKFHRIVTENVGCCLTRLWFSFTI